MIDTFVGILIMAMGTYLMAIFTSKIVLPEYKSGYPEVLLPATFVYACLFGLVSLGYCIFNN